MIEKVPESMAYAYAAQTTQTTKSTEAPQATGVSGEMQNVTAGAMMLEKLLQSGLVHGLNLIA